MDLPRAIPRLPSAAAAFALLEALRVRIAAAARRGVTLRSVLSVDLDNLEVDATLAALLKEHTDSGIYSIVSSAAYFVRLVTRHSELLSVLLHHGTLHELAGGGEGEAPPTRVTASTANHTRAPAGHTHPAEHSSTNVDGAQTFDLIVVPAWRLRLSPAPGADVAAAERHLMAQLARQLSPGGVMLVVVQDTNTGPVTLRRLLQAPPAGALSGAGSGLSAWLPPFMSFAAPTATARAPAAAFDWQAPLTDEDGQLRADVLSSAAAAAGVELLADLEILDSQVDITDLLRHANEPAAQAVLADMIGCAAAEFAAFAAGAQRAFLDGLAAHTLHNVRVRDPGGGAAPVVLHAPLRIFHVFSRHAGHTMTIPASPASVAPLSRFAAFASARSPAVTSPARIVTKSPLTLPPMPLLYGVPGTLPASDDGTRSFHARVFNGTVAPAASSTSAAAVPCKSPATGAAVTLTFDPWFPHGTFGGFYNMGLAHWLEQRRVWSARPHGFVHPPYPPPVDSEELIDELTDVTREVELPGPVRLPDMINMMVTAWDPVTDEDSDPDW